MPRVVVFAVPPRLHRPPSGKSAGLSAAGVGGGKPREGDHGPRRVEMTVAGVVWPVSHGALAGSRHAAGAWVDVPTSGALGETRRPLATIGRGYRKAADRRADVSDSVKGALFWGM